MLKERLISKSKKAKPSLKQVVLECVSSEVGRGHYQSKSFDVISYLGDTELYFQAKQRGYDEVPTKLFDMADKVDIDNTRGQFEDRVIVPIQRAQGIYY